MKALTEGELAAGYSLGVRRPWMADEGRLVPLPADRPWTPFRDRRAQWRESKRRCSMPERVAA